MRELEKFIKSQYLGTLNFNRESLMHAEWTINKWVGEKYPMIAVNYNYVKILVTGDYSINVQIDENLIIELERYYPESLI